MLNMKHFFMSALLMYGALRGMDNPAMRSAQEQSELDEKLAHVLRLAKGDKKKELLKEAKRLVRQVADVNGYVYEDDDCDEAWIDTQLRVALCEKYPHDSIKWLLRHGANPNECAKGSFPVLMYALIFNNDFKLFKRLIRAGAHLDDSSTGSTPLIYAATVENFNHEVRYKFVRILLTTIPRDVNKYVIEVRDKPLCNYVQLLPMDLIKYTLDFYNKNVNWHVWNKDSNGSTVFNLLYKNLYFGSEDDKKARIELYRFIWDRGVCAITLD